MSEGVHPNSLRNLQPFSEDNLPDRARPRGPLITPRLRKIANLPQHEYLRLLQMLNERELDMSSDVLAADIMAMTLWQDALQTGIRTTGHHSRREILDRLDGVAARQPIEVDVGVRVILKWTNDESERITDEVIEGESRELESNVAPDTDA